MSAADGQPAGPGSRSYAFLIDWHIRLLAALVWMLGAVLALRPHWSPESAGARIAILPALGLYFLYHPVVELLDRGCTPGKRIAGLRVVAREGGAPGCTAILVRNALRAVDSLPVCYLVGLASCFLRSDRARIGDLAAGTRVVESVARIEAPRADAEALVAGLLERWSLLDPLKRSEIARALLRRLEPGAAAAEPGVPVAGDPELLRRLRAWSRRRRGE